MIISQIFVRISSFIEAILQKSNPKARYSSVLLLGFSFLIFCSCSTPKTVPVETLHHDTLYINKEKYDSIYIDNSHLVDRGGDTVYIKDKLIEYRYRFLRDTIRISKCDSIPYEVRITEVKEVSRRRNLFDYISYVCFGIILGLVVNKARAIVRTST